MLLVLALYFLVQHLHEAQCTGDVFDIEYRFSNDAVDSPEYSMDLNNSGPAAVNSEISFYARFSRNNISEHLELTRIDNHSLLYVHSEAPYLFQWLTNACRFSLKPESCNDITEVDDLSETITYKRIFTIFDVILGNIPHNMTVQVFKKISDHLYLPFLNKTTTFFITDTLNGEFEMHENMTRTAARDTYSTGGNITFNATIYDTCRSPAIMSVWEIFGPNGKLIFVRHDTVLSTRLTARGLHRLYAAVVFAVNVNDQLGNQQSVYMNTSFTRIFMMEDPVNNVQFIGNRDYYIGDNLVINLTCSGSSAFQIDLTLLSPGRHLLINESITSDVCLFLIESQNLNKTGQYVLNFTLMNAVSAVNEFLKVNVHHSPSPTSSAVIPMLAVIIFAIAVSAIWCSFQHDVRENLHVIEEANFGFRDEDNMQILRRNVMSWAKDVRNLCIRGHVKRRFSYSETNSHTVMMKVLEPTYRSLSPE